MVEKIRELNQQKYFVAIVSNQGRVPKSIPFSVAEEAMGNLVRSLGERGATVDYFDFSIGGEGREKPKPAMARSLTEVIQRKFGNEYRIDPKNSFMVGDAAYQKGDLKPDKSRGEDFSDFDRKFAEGLNIDFKEPDEFFGWRAVGISRIRSTADIDSLNKLRALEKKRADWEELFKRRSDEILQTEQDLEGEFGKLREKQGTSDILNRLTKTNESAQYFDLTLGQIQEERRIQDRLDQLSQSEFDLLLQDMLENSRLTAEEAMILHPGIPAARLNATADRLASLHEDYLRQKIQFGQGKDYKRYTAVASFFNEQNRFASELKKLFPRKNASARVTQLLDASLDTLRRVSGFISVTKKMARPAAKALVEAFRVQTPPRRTGFSDAWLDLFRQWGKASGLRVEIEGAEHLANTGEEVVSIIAPIHREANLDAVALAGLQLDDSIVFGALNLEKHPIFGATGNPLMRPVVRALEDHDNFILVTSKQEDPLVKVVRLLKGGKTQKVIIFPEGQVSLGMNESRPVRESFSTKFLEKLSQEGIRYQVVPVTLGNGGPLLHFETSLNQLKVDPGKETLNVKFHAPVDQAAFERLSKANHAEDFNYLLRAIWLENLPSDSHYLLGQARWSDVVEKSAGLYPGLSSSRCVTRRLRQRLLDQGWRRWIKP